MNESEYVSISTGNTQNLHLRIMQEPYKILKKISDQFHIGAEQIMSIALCYYDLGFYEDAENSYHEA